MNDFVINESGVLEKYNGCERHVVVPREVTAIGYEAFEHNEVIESVVLPEGVTDIYPNAFRYCTSLKEISIPDTVSMIWSRAFYHCESLEKLTLPRFLQSISSNMCESCFSLKEVIIPESVEMIGRKAFCGCQSLKEVQFPSALNSIRSSAFEDCISLENAKLPEGVEVEPYAFDGCALKRPILEAGRRALLEDPNMKAWMEDNEETLLYEMVSYCYYRDTDDIRENFERTGRIAALLLDRAKEDVRYAVAYVILAAENAQNHDPDEGFFLLDEAARLFIKYPEFDEACDAFIEKFEMELDTEDLLQTIRFYLLGV